MFIQRDVILVLASLARLAPAESTGEWRSDLAWSKLESQLSSSASLINVAFEDFYEDCFPEFADKTYLERTNHGLIDKPSGLCVSQLFCAYERCYPRPDADGHANTTLTQRLTDTAGLYAASYSEMTTEIQGWLEDPENPSLNIPSKVLFPVVASDVVAAIKFAKENSLEISVKNSGHSFIGASTKKDTLHLNMNKFTHYAPTGIVDCPIDDNEVIIDMSDQPCALAAARGKPGYIRVGGGENWDKTYRAVTAANEAENKYHVVGGAAGTVSPMGWTFQGGLAGTVGGRRYGFGVDQVLQVEMVLPNGQHVRFGPTEWEDATADGFIVPKTTSVGGECRVNPEEEDEEKWMWSTCPDDVDINFDDLWFAVNGGGGGTWGVVTSIYLQLHNYLPPFFYSPLSLAGFPCGIDYSGEAYVDLLFQFEIFRAFLFVKPSFLDITEANSSACGSPDGINIIYCVDEGLIQPIVDAWSSYLNEYWIVDAPKDEAAACFYPFNVSHADSVLFPDGHPFAGQIDDNPNPTIPSTGDESQVNVLVPKTYFEEGENMDNFINQIIIKKGLGHPYYAFGPGTSAASDQANSLSAAHRGAGAKIYLTPEVFYGEYFSKWYDLSDENNFPGFLGANHVANNMFGPLKQNWTKACPQEWTQEEREEKCISIQEAIYGTKTLARLEAIKEAIDPDYMFDCIGCIGNNRAKNKDPDDPSSGSQAPDDPSSGSHHSAQIVVVLVLSIVVLLFSH